jgi:MYXO-CTERM domain-containing protein
MTNKKLLMFAVAGTLAPAASSGIANAESQGSAVSIMVPAPVKDLAPVTGTPPRLRRTDQEQPGNEMSAFAFFTDPATGKQTNGLYFSMSTELSGGRAATNKIQLSATPFALTQDPATGTVSAVADFAAAKFVTNNNGNERRNANAPTASTINNGSVVLVKYNYQPNGTNDTVTYFQAFNQAGVAVLPQTRAYAKNNDDCSTHQDGNPGVAFKTAAGVTKIVEWAGCNGNGADDGWMFVTQVSCDSEAAPTKCTFANVFDISLAQQEERTRGACTVTDADKSFAVCSWTEGNNQPARNGTWLAGVSLDPAIKGSNQQQALLWKQQIGGRINNNPAANNQTTYAQRAIQERIMVPNATTGALEASDKLIFQYGDAVGRNNNKGTYYTNMVSVIQVTAKGPTFLQKPVDISSQLSGLGGTHLGSTAAVFGPTATPGLVFLSGSLNGGGINSMVRSVSFDPATQYLPKDLGAQAGAPHDAHLYSNYLGNNPGNQGRNHSAVQLVQNPFAGQAGSTSKFLLLTSTSAKTLTTTCAGCTDTMSNPAIKLTGLMTVTPMGGAAATTGTGTGTGGGDTTGSGTTGTGSGSSTGSGDGSSDPGTTLGGCSTGGGSTGLATFLLIGLAAFIRRRR